jgi:hypothetical protein
MKTDLEKFIELFDSVKIEYTLNKESDQMEIELNNSWAICYFRFDLDGKFKNVFVTD